MLAIGKFGCYRFLNCGNIRNKTGRRYYMKYNRFRAFRIRFIVILRDGVVIIDLEIP